MDLLAPFAPTHEELVRLRPEWHRVDRRRTDYPGFAGYHLCERIAVAPDDECFYAVKQGLAGFTKPCFLRRFPATRLAEEALHALERRATLTERGIERIFELGRQGGQAFVVSQLVEGLSMADLQRALDQQGRTLPWSVTLALCSDAGQRLDRMHGQGHPHGALTPARLRLSLRGQVSLCHGLPRGEPGDAERDHRALLGAVLPLALRPDRRPAVHRILATDDPATLDVLGDHLLEREAAPPGPLLALLRGPGRAAADVAGHLDPHQARALWQLVLDLSPDMRGGYQPLGRRRA